MNLDPRTLGETPEEYLENPDGSVQIMDALPVSPEVSTEDFTENLATVFDESLLNHCATELVELVKRDRESREKRDKQYEEGLRRTGLGDDAPGGAEFQGASRAVHPVLVEACVDFSARAIKELFPSSGPVKSYVVGENSPQKLERASRKARYMNWQMTTQIEEYRSELEQLLTQLPMGGSQYQKFWRDNKLGRIRCEFVPVDDILLPYAATNFYTAQRATHRQMVTRAEFDERVASGLYRDIDVGSAPSVLEQSATETANDKIEGKEEDGYNEDGLRPILEIYTWKDFEDDPLTKGEVAPYIITIDEHSEKTLAIYRNWKPGDPRLRRLDWFAEWKFVPWRGAYAIGLPHIIGGLSGALTGALRALLDSAHINNAASMLKLKGGRVTGQNKTVSVTEVTEIESPPGVDDIRKIAMPMPFNPPSPVLLELMDKLYSLSLKTMASVNDQLANVGDRTPVGTTMAIIEQGSAVYSAIHARLHHSQKKAMEIIHRLNSEYLDEQSVMEDLGELVVSQDDFLGSMDVVPVSDPTIFSEAQRFAQSQALVQMAADQTVPWNKINLYRRVLKQMRIENVDELLPEVKEPVTADFIKENFDALRGYPLKPAHEQNHMQHIMGHMMFVMSPFQIQNPLVKPEGLLQIIDHVGGHLQQMQEQMQQQMGELGVLQQWPIAQQQMQQALGPMMQQLMQAQQELQKRIPPPPMPPEVQASIQIAQMEVQRKTQQDQGMLQLRQQELAAEQQHQLGQFQAEQAFQQMKQQLEQSAAAAKLQLEQSTSAAELQLKQAQLAAKQQIDLENLTLQNDIESLRQQVELMKNERDNAQKQQTELLKNTEDNETRIEIEHIRQEGENERQESQPAQKDGDG